jgi:hypothetical protein
MQCRENQRRQTTVTEESNRLFELLLGAELVGVAALALPAVGRTRRETGLVGSVSCWDRCVSEVRFLT